MSMNQYGNSSHSQRGPAQQPPPSQSNPSGGSYFVDQKKGEINELKQVCVRSKEYTPVVVVALLVATRTASAAAVAVIQSCFCTWACLYRSVVVLSSKCSCASITARPATRQQQYLALFASYSSPEVAFSMASLQWTQLQRHRGETLLSLVWPGRLSTCSISQGYSLALPPLEHDAAGRNLSASRPRRTLVHLSRSS